MPRVNLHEFAEYYTHGITVCRLFCKFAMNDGGISKL